MTRRRAVAALLLILLLPWPGAQAHLARRISAYEDVHRFAVLDEQRRAVYGHVHALNARRSRVTLVCTVGAFDLVGNRLGRDRTLFSVGARREGSGSYGVEFTPDGRWEVELLHCHVR